MLKVGYIDLVLYQYLLIIILLYCSQICWLNPHVAIESDIVSVLEFLVSLHLLHTNCERKS